MGQAGANASTFSEQGYTAWRSEALAKNFLRHFNVGDVQGKDILDFGCGEGCLSLFLAGYAKSVIGIDANLRMIAKAQDNLATSEVSSPKPVFYVAAALDTIDVPDESLDVILCFDVLEHVMDYPAILREWCRILRPNAKVLIWWVPWWNPYGPHIESLVPIPWAHVVFSDRTLVRTCARMYDSNEFQPRVWDLDEAGQKRPNKWLHMSRLPEVNRLTMAEFEKAAARSDLRIVRREIHGFGGSALSRLTRPLVRIPVVREFFCNFTVYELVKPK
jgi:ubiquinone/menaquinone biosynthesis C-methylase UbiE